MSAAVIVGMLVGGVAGAATVPGLSLRERATVMGGWVVVVAVIARAT